MLKSGIILDVGRPSHLLRSFGVPDVPIQLRQRILAKAVEKHGIKADELKGLSAAIQNLLAVFASKKGDGHLIVLTKLPHADGNIIAALDLTAKRDGLEITDITSLHPKPGDKIAH